MIGQENERRAAKLIQQPSEKRLDRVQFSNGRDIYPERKRAGAGAGQGWAACFRVLIVWRGAARTELAQHLEQPEYRPLETSLRANGDRARHQRACTWAGSSG